MLKLSILAFRRSAEKTSLSSGASASSPSPRSSRQSPASTAARTWSYMPSAVREWLPCIEARIVAEMV